MDDAVYPGVFMWPCKPAGQQPLSVVAANPCTAGRHRKKRKMGPAGFEPATKGLCVPLRLSPPLSSSWAGPSLHFTCLPSGLYTFCHIWQLGSGLACFLRSLAFPEFDRFYRDPVRLTCRPQDQGNPCGDAIQNPNRKTANSARVSAQALPLKSPALTVELRSHASEYILDFGFCRSCLDRLWLLFSFRQSFARPYDAFCRQQWHGISELNQRGRRPVRSPAESPVSQICLSPPICTQTTQC